MALEGVSMETPWILFLEATGLGGLLLGLQLHQHLLSGQVLHLQLAGGLVCRQDKCHLLLLGPEGGELVLQHLVPLDPAVHLHLQCVDLVQSPLAALGGRQPVAVPPHPPLLLLLGVQQLLLHLPPAGGGPPLEPPPHSAYLVSGPALLRGLELGTVFTRKTFLVG